MKVLAEPTDQVTTVDGVPARVWNARTENGVAFVMFVARCAVPAAADQSQFQLALQEMPAPREVSAAAALQAFDARLVQ